VAPETTTLEAQALFKAILEVVLNICIIITAALEDMAIDSKAISIIILVEVVVVVCITTEISPIEAEDIKAKAALIRAVANMVVTSKVEIIDTKEVPSNITNKANSKANSNNTEAQETIKAEEIRATSITRKEVAADPTIKIKDLDKVANHIEVVEVDQDQNET